MTGAGMIQALERGGFAFARVRGSHHFLRHPDGRTTVVPVDAGDGRPSARTGEPVD
jgi:predicted RNA binding protein YcfA (HicA-like mRNA interferase family)